MSCLSVGIGPAGSSVLGIITAVIFVTILSGWMSALGNIIWGIIGVIMGIACVVQFAEWARESSQRNWAKDVGLWDLALDFQRRSDKWDEEEKAREKAAKEARRKEYPEFYRFLQKVKVVVVSAFLIWLAVMIYLSIADAYHLWPSAP